MEVAWSEILCLWMMELMCFWEMKPGYDFPS